MASELRRAPRALPATTEDLMADRKLHSQPNINNEVEAIVLQLWTDERFQRYLDAVWPEDSVEGSLLADDFEAAQMIREKATSAGNQYLASKKKETIRKSLSVVLRRFNKTRKYRRDEVMGAENSQ